MSRKRFRQGDVVLKQIQTLPLNVVPVKTGAVLAVGEATGHSHRLVGGEFHVWRRGPERFIEVKKPTTLVHDEHDRIVIPKGVYEQLAEQEYDYFADAERMLVAGESEEIYAPPIRRVYD